MSVILEQLTETLHLHPDTIQYLAGKQLSKLSDGADLRVLKSSMHPVLYNQFMYNLSHVDRSRYIYDLAMKRLGAKRDGLSVLDIGCGLGGGLIIFGQNGFKLRGIELNPKSRELCQNNLAHNKLSARITTEDLCSDHLGGEKFDVLICNSVVEHVNDPEAFIGRFSELLNPGGVLVLGVANCEALGNVIADPHYQLFGMTLMNHALSEKLYNLTAKVKQTYSVTEWRSIDKYGELIRNSVGRYDLVPPSAEIRDLEAVPDLIARATLAFETTTKLPHVKADAALSKMLKIRFSEYLRTVLLNYEIAILTGFDKFKQRHIFKSFQIVARRGDV